jgi:hypothetical protein
LAKSGRLRIDTARQMLDQFLSTDDADRALGTLWKLLRNDLSRWALTGGFAVEIHCLRLGKRPSMRLLNDLDFVTSSFECIPASLAEDFLFRHIHPLDPPGKTMMQFVDPNGRLRIDVFRAYGATMNRTLPLELPFGTMQLISLEDLLARTVRLLLDLAAGIALPAKHARDFWRLAKVVEPGKVEAAWQDHRKPQQPANFEQAASLAGNLILERQDLLIAPGHSKDAAEVCPRCAPTAAFPLADPNLVLSLLGYC